MIRNKKLGRPRKGSSPKLPACFSIETHIAEEIRELAHALRKTASELVNEILTEYIGTKAQR